MLTVKPQLNLRNAREYFREHLSVGDYYSDKERVAGEWFGVGANRLGLKGVVNETAFLRLCEGLHPGSGKRLTLRRNSSRHGPDGRQLANRRVFYDFTLSPPKSVSVVGLYQDDRILQLHELSVRKALTELERFAESRLRRAGQRSQHRTGNIVAATFRHDTSRELDPHLHTHCVVFNATFDDLEQRWKALEVQGMYRAQKFVENYYFHEMAKGLRALGYETENETRAFRITGVPESVTTRFSKRRQEIDRETDHRLKRGTWKGNTKDLREQVARDVRKRKIRDSSADRLRALWAKQLSDSEAAALVALRAVRPRARRSCDVAGVVAWSDEALFERRSVVQDHELLATALARGRGENFDLPTLRRAVDARGYLRDEGTSRITSPEVLRDELEVVVAAHDGLGRYPELGGSHRTSSTLSAEQKVAVEAILGSRDFITLFRGGAGTGKSFTLKQVERGLTAAGRPVVVLAPQLQQVRALQADGLPTETLARFLEIKEMTRGAVVVVDEAGQVGGRQLRELVAMVQANGGRLILSGDTRQHGAVPASDALRAIEKHAGLKTAKLSTIRRQDPHLGASAKERIFIRRYRAAVKAAARGDSAGSFARLDALGCIRERAPNDRRAALAAEYLAATSQGDRALVVAQTREEARLVNEAIREGLHKSGTLPDGKKITAYSPIDLGEAQKRDPRFFQAGQSAFFLRRYGRYEKGELCPIVSAGPRGLILEKGGRRATLSYRYTDRIAVVTPAEIWLARGDRLQLKFNGKSAEGLPLHNGELVTVQRVLKNGRLVVSGDDGSRKTLTANQRLFLRGYAVTSYGSQGKTVDTVIMGDAGSAAATSANQWYVTISRGRKRVVVFTSDKEALRDAVVRTGDRALALDLITPVTPLVRPENWQREALEVIERNRRYNEVMALRRPSELRQRIVI